MTAPEDTAPGALTQRTQVLANATLVLAGATLRGAVAIRGEEIAEILPGASVPRGAEDMQGDFLAPGLIELHTDNLERHMRPRPGANWPLRPAIVAHDAELASVGITTVFDALRLGFGRTPSKKGQGRYARSTATEIAALHAEGLLRISHRVHLRAEICSETLIAELEEFGPEDRVGIVSLMDHTPGQRQFADPERHRTYLRGKYQMTEEEIAAHFANLHRVRAEYGDVHVDAGVRHARRLGAVLASHDDTTAAHVADSAAHGVRLAEFPTALAAARACRAAGIAVMMGAPNLIRGGSHSGNVAAAELWREGCLDILSSDYAPSSLLAAAVRLGLDGGDMAAGLARVTSSPAAASGLDDRGRIAPGLRADLVRFRLSGDMAVPLGTWVRGRRVA